MTMHTFTNNLNTSIRLNRDLHMHNKLARYARLATFCHSKYILQKQKAVATIERQQIAVNEPRKSVFISSRQPLAIQTPIFSRPTPSTDVEPSGNHWTFSRLRRHTQPGIFYYSYAPDKEALPISYIVDLKLSVLSYTYNNRFSFEATLFYLYSGVTKPRKSVFIPSRQPLAIQTPIFSRPTPSTDVEPSGNHWTFSRLRRHTQPGTFYYQFDSRTPTFGFENTLNRHISSVLNNNMVVCLSKVFPSPYPVSRCFLLPGIPMPLAPNNSRPTSSTV